MRNIAIIPARSGSKGLKDKNIKEFHGKPLIAYTIEAALKSGKYDCVHVSTDSEEYAFIAREYGADVPFLRGEELSSDHASSWDVLRNVVEKYQEMGETFDTVSLLQPTSPLRDEMDIISAFDVFEKKSADAVVGICELDHSIEICNTIDEDGCMNGFFDTNRSGRRQDMGTYYRINGAFYVQKTEGLMRRENLYGPKCYAYVMSKLHSIDIDDEYDFFLAKAAYQYKNGERA